LVLHFGVKRWCYGKIKWPNVIWPDPSSRLWRSEMCENGRFQSLSKHNQKTDGDGELWYSKTVCKDMWYSSSFGIMWPSNLGCSTFGKRILPLMRSRLAVPYDAYFGILC